MPTLTDDWPQLDRVGRFSEVVVLSDFLADAETHARAAARARRARRRACTCCRSSIPAEEAFPYEGRLEFRDPESGETWLTERAGGLRADYRARLEAHRAADPQLRPAGRLLLRRPPHRPAGGRRPALPAEPAFRRSGTPSPRGGTLRMERPAA